MSTEAALLKDLAIELGAFVPSEMIKIIRELKEFKRNHDSKRPHELAAEYLRHSPQLLMEVSSNRGETEHTILNFGYTPTHADLVERAKREVQGCDLEDSPSVIVYAAVLEVVAVNRPALAERTLEGEEILIDNTHA
jgi:hypothetical protein